MSELGETSRLISSLSKICVKEKAPNSHKIASALLTKDNLMVPTKLVIRPHLPPKCSSKWVRAPVVYSKREATQESAPPYILQWTEASRTGQVAGFRKFDIGLDLPRYNADDYKKITEKKRRQSYVSEEDLEFSDKDFWSKEETDYLWHLLEACEGNFLVAHDRFSLRFPEKTIEDLKERVIFVIKRLVEENLIKFDLGPYAKTTFDKNLELVRRLNLEKVWRRKPEATRDEERLLASIKQAENLIKMRERESRFFQKILNCSSEERAELSQTATLTVQSFLKNNVEPEAVVACHVGLLLKPVLTHLSPKLNEEILGKMKKMNLLSNTYATEETMRLFDKVRNQYLQFLSLNKRKNDKKVERDLLLRMTESATENPPPPAKEPQPPVKAVKEK